MSTQIPGLYIMETEEKGRGVFTSIPISKGDLIESAPVIVLDDKDRLIIHKTLLHDYYFLWEPGEDEEYEAAIALGYGSLYNHSKEPNAEFVPVFDEKVIEFIALRDIAAGEEILIEYDEGGNSSFELWF